MKSSRYQHLLLSLIAGSLLYQSAMAISSEPGGDFTLTDHLGEAWSLQNARGKVVLLVFGYTSCPDVCPTSLLTVQQVLGTLGDQADSVQPLFVSVDPKRDTPAVMKNYLGYFHPSIIGLSGELSMLKNISQHYRTSFGYSGDTDSPSYVVDHSSSLYVINDQGELTNIIPYGTPADIIVDSVKRLLPPE